MNNYQKNTEITDILHVYHGQSMIYFHKKTKLSPKYITNRIYIDMSRNVQYDRK